MTSPKKYPRLCLRAALLVAAGSLGLAGCSYSYEFDSFTVGSDAEGRAPEPLSNSQFVRGVYADVLGRAPAVHDFSIEDAKGSALYAFPINEQRTLVNALDGMGDPAPMRALLCAGLLGSSEIAVPDKADVQDPGGFVRERFRALLGREPNAYEAGAFEDAWRTDEATGPRSVIRAIVGSREYQSR
jgi:hypothetical protein